MGAGGLQELFDILEQAGALLDRDPVDERDLLAALGEIYKGLFLADFRRYDVAAVRAEAPGLVRGIFELYLALRARIPDWQRQGLMTRPVQAVLRDVFRAARYARDLIGEIGHDHPRLGRKEPTHAAFAGPDSYTDLNPAFGETLALMPGDVLLQRGMVHNSAAIARIGDNDSQFSHVSIVARDPSGELVIVEALIEEGSLVKSVEDALNHGLGRAILFRHRDRALAEAAAEMIRAAIARTGTAIAPRILYDFTMELDGSYRDLYCARLVRLAYSMASTGAVRLPAFPTRLDMRNRDFISRIGVTARETFAPGDMELEPDFDIVAEWRDYCVTSELRLKDMIMVKLFEWMELASFRFRPTLLVHFVGFFGWLSARLPSFAQRIAQRLAGKVPINMSRSAVGAVAMLHWTAEALYKDLRRQEDESIRVSGRPLHPRLVLHNLEQLRRKRGRRIVFLETWY